MGGSRGKMIYKFGDFEFRSKSEAHVCIGQWLKEVKPTVQITNGRGFCLLRDLLFQHPEAELKIGAGIQRFEIRRNPVFATQNTFYVIRSDGSETDFSFRTCLLGKKRSKYSDFCSAARNAIRDQIVVFKTSQFIGINNPRCGLTGVELEFHQCHVDHVITFDSLLKDFIQKYNIDVDSVIDDKPHDGEIFPIFTDDDIRRQWIEFHRKHAVLRLTTPEANLARRAIND
jgi:hypothetical protein